MENHNYINLPEYGIETPLCIYWLIVQKYVLIVLMMIMIVNVLKI